MGKGFDRLVMLDDLGIVISNDSIIQESIRVDMNSSGALGIGIPIIRYSRNTFSCIVGGDEYNIVNYDDIRHSDVREWSLGSRVFIRGSLSYGGIDKGYIEYIKRLKDYQGSRVSVIGGIVRSIDGYYQLGLVGCDGVIIGYDVASDFSHLYDVGGVIYGARELKDRLRLGCDIIVGYYDRGMMYGGIDYISDINRRDYLGSYYRNGIKLFGLGADYIMPIGLYEMAIGNDLGSEFYLRVSKEEIMRDRVLQDIIYRSVRDINSLEFRENYLLLEGGMINRVYEDAGGKYSDRFINYNKCYGYRSNIYNNSIIDGGFISYLRGILQAGGYSGMYDLRKNLTLGIL